MGMDQDDVVLAPYTTVMKRLLAVTYLQGIFASALTEDMTDNATEEITAILRKNHKLKESDDDDFTIRSQQELSTMLNTTTDLMTTLLACIAGISLVVGGIGIMNIMLVSVTESYLNQYYRRYYRNIDRYRSIFCRKKYCTLAYIHTKLECTALFCRMYYNRSIFRMVSGAKSI